ncbi:MAG: rod shape-determining protein MreD [Actinobacteria bacterium]|nr:rod shape-determining protein MreD [Actinomycetota bacterium]
MTPRLRVLLVLVTAVALEGTLLDELRVGGVSVELLLLVSILTGYHGGPERGAIAAFFAGLLHDSIVGAPLGLHALVYPPMAVAVSSLELRMLRSTPVTDGLAVLAAVAAGQGLASAVGMLFGVLGPSTEEFVRQAILAGILTAVVSAPVNRVVRWAATGGLPGTIELRRGDA